jgi:hypothetical protein
MPFTGILAGGIAQAGSWERERRVVIDSMLDYQCVSIFSAVPSTRKIWHGSKHRGARGAVGFTLP